eukprot:TRINITY_DN7238_c1_g2_i1.p1 TRINITY_DN7238_c1_g2~~TRINITY_DN7238_c1_g2_i1.p1  ORF type:complete len:185 (-),score=-21.20 TRINITY_DN7238_c1_g2_i1:72-575(-)
MKTIFLFITLSFLPLLHDKYNCQQQTIQVQINQKFYLALFIIIIQYTNPFISLCKLKKNHIFPSTYFTELHQSCNQLKKNYSCKNILQETKIISIVLTKVSTEINLFKDEKKSLFTCLNQNNIVLMVYQYFIIIHKIHIFSNQPQVVQGIHLIPKKAHNYIFVIFVI